MLTLCLVCAGSDSARADEWAQADSLTVRLPPSAFPELPAQVKRWLSKCGCRIPQPFDQSSAKPVNVARGEFEREGQLDWAVLCSRARTSTILIFRGGSPTAIDSLAPAKDANFLQGEGPGKIGYSRLIQTIRPSKMRKIYEVWAAGSKPPVPLLHDGIENFFLGKASVVYYRNKGKWLELVGGD